MDNYNLTKDEIYILAPPKNIAFGAFKSSVAVGATIFFGEKIADKLIPSSELFAHKSGSYIMLAGLLGGAIAGTISTKRANEKLKSFTQRLEAETNAAEAAEQKSR